VEREKMKIVEYEFSSRNWKINKVCFQQSNLIVGDSGSGKTRLLNTIFNLGTFVAQGKLGTQDNAWRLTLSIGENIYNWNVITEEDDKPFVKEETIYLNGKEILRRDKGNTIFNQKPIIKLPKNEMAISALKEEDIIKPLYQGFSKIMRRKFFTDVLEESSGIYAMNQRLIEKIGEKRDLLEVFNANLALNPKLYILKTYFPEIYKNIISIFRETFQFIKEISIIDSSDVDLLNIPGRAPIFCVKESNVDKWIRLDELSSGMQKVLLILTDLYSMPSDSIYMIDEYENSLGVTPINFLPELIFSEKLDIQIFITSHHPYIISNFPVKYWYIAHRQGMDCSFDYGENLEKRYNISSQEKYIQLINDPIYGEGVK
jgi:predicted ATPase